MKGSAIMLLAAGLWALRGSSAKFHLCLAGALLRTVHLGVAGGQLPR